MSSSADFVAYVEDQLGDLDIRSGKMFGEYCVYCDDKVVGFVCDDVLLITPTGADPVLFERTYPGKPYPGAKDYHAVPGDALEDREWLQAAIQATADARPAPTPRRKK